MTQKTDAAQETTWLEQGYMVIKTRVVLVVTGSCSIS
jgi:hypothetical protein